MSNRVRYPNKVDTYHEIPRREKYKPFIAIRNVPSLGRSSRILGIKTNRQHEFLSDLERNYYHILEFSDHVIDIREQFPLQLERTLLIADELGVKHPIHPKTKDPVHITSDFNITIKEDKKAKDLVRTIKRKDDLLDKRTIEKFEIEKRYWDVLNIDWGIVTEKEIDKTLALNIADVMHYYSFDSLEFYQIIGEEEVKSLIVTFIQRLIDTDKTVREVSTVFERDFQLGKGVGITLFKHLIARKYIKVDLFEPLNLDRPHLRVDLTNKSKVLGEDVS
ncbi:heteromeric transposase endonuclease subunit TnsA [Natranaerobius thermophilus JW/NM-WN-LF]|uniref:TnsA endonuclease n=1 Tax=Natranaerobius thermophilus (strain ATCC BAA-1301 / DSM 18059 / JW/NM-WN-LF) TaxID=457570 RepID=B2A4S2_NATTJ|nr:heteromeric transposase endonuclease subunit TnsA [Natranaerobius thermophilus]ACB83844.1 TnsA endonuclease [Natranaerobius thermophilus JW/NM-WN-LF]